jgi:hypothetical protein
MSTGTLETSLYELEMHAHTARKLLDNNDWQPSRLLWERLTGHLESAVRQLSTPTPPSIPTEKDTR